MAANDSIQWNILDSAKIAKECRDRIEKLLAEKTGNSKIVPAEWKGATVLDTKSFIEAYESNWKQPVHSVCATLEDLNNCLGISYRWGAPNAHVSLTGFVTRVARLNCNADALVSTLKRCKFPFVWLDSLCIDQSAEGLPSRITEVSLMRRYYENFGLVSILGSFAVTVDDEDATGEELVSQIVPQLLNNKYTANGWHGRAWTAQESGVAKEIEWCGYRGPQSEFRDFYMQVASSIQENENLTDEIVYLGRAIADSWEAGETASIYNAIQLINERAALYPEDLITALCPLIDNSLVGKMPPEQWEMLYPKLVAYGKEEFQDSLKNYKDPIEDEWIPVGAYMRLFFFCIDLPNGGDLALWGIRNEKFREWLGKPTTYRAYVMTTEALKSDAEYHVLIPLDIDDFKMFVELDVKFDGVHCSIQTARPRFLAPLSPEDLEGGSWMNIVLK